MQKTAIQWTAFSANPLKYRRVSDGKVVWACIKTSGGCSRCYSEGLALRYDRGKLFNAANMDELAPFLDETELHQMRTKKRCGGAEVSGSRCFVGDMTDLFGEWVSDDILNRLFSGTLELRTDVTWQILTKRAERMQRYLSWRYGKGRIPPRHIHFGVSCEDQRRADERISHLLRCPAAVRFLSCEPLLGEIDLCQSVSVGDAVQPDDFTECQYCDGLGYHESEYTCLHCHGEGIREDRIHQVIIGVESNGPRVGRLGEFNSEAAWIEGAESIVDQCRAANVAAFVKQIPVNGRVEHDIAKFPAALRFREFPAGATQ